MRQIIASLLVFATMFWMSDPAVFAFEENATTTPAVIGTSEPVLGDMVLDLLLPDVSDTATTTAPLVDEVIAQIPVEPVIETATTTAAVVSGSVANEPVQIIETLNEEIAADGVIEVPAPAASVILPPQFEILASWQMSGAGIDDQSAESAQFVPTGQFQISKKIKVCGAVAGEVAKLDGVYGQIFYPGDASFAPDDAKGRQGCGQVIGPICKMEKLGRADSFDLLCEKILKNNTNLVTFAENSNYIDLCAVDGKLLAETAAVYCCDQELAFDDIAGNYETALIAKGADGTFSNMLTNKFTYLPQAKIDIDFTNVYYGEVKENVETITDFGSSKPGAEAAETISRASVRNVGNVPAKLSLWQDDMGLGKTGDAYNIQYGARISGADTIWVRYAPFDTAVMPEALAPGQSADMDFSVKVTDFPVPSGETKINYTGKMKIDAVETPGYQCKKSAVKEESPFVTNEMSQKPMENNNTDVKPEIEITNSTTTEQAIK
ncbi:MAG: hypothetical protein WCX69_02105 [Candidatus Paceibacterota bacterium]